MVANPIAKFQTVVDGTVHRATAQNDGLFTLLTLNAIMLTGKEPPSSDCRKRSSMLLRMHCCKALRCAGSHQVDGNDTQLPATRCSQR